ncbi:hypothetical protein SAMN04487779_1010177 [Belnapia rosea]|uniref:Uncharacterized protein n=2 Tax=Belnapia rosea TaxID=938405 RepID=A0A1G6WFS1_9PROT|nr:hypothetical protein SAMN04487779_1010177 [Belnapia rosea]
MYATSNVTRTGAYSVTATSTTSPTATDAPTSESYQMDLTVETGSVSSESSGMVAEVSGEATAVGNDTYASADVTAQASSTDSSSEAYVSTSMVAAGETSDGVAYASTSAYSDIYGDADYALSFDFKESSTTQTADGATASSVSVVEDYALDIKQIDSSPDQGWDSAEISPSGAADSVSQPELDLDCGCGDIDLDLDGNIALANIDAVAFGDDSLVEVDASVFVIEDEFSSVTVTSLIGVD